MLPTDELDYDLPERLIATHPASPRDSARLLVVSRSDPDRLEHRCVSDLPGLLDSGDMLVFNTTRVVPARLTGVRRDTRGRVEGMFLRQSAEDEWVVLLRGRRLKPGVVIDLHLTGRGVGAFLVLRKKDESEQGAWFVRVSETSAPQDSRLKTQDPKNPIACAPGFGEPQASRPKTQDPKNPVACAPGFDESQASRPKPQDPKNPVACAPGFGEPQASRLKTQDPKNPVACAPGFGESQASRPKPQDPKNPVACAPGFGESQASSLKPQASLLDRVGLTPLPPYILRARRHAHEIGDERQDRASYQTVYAKSPGSVAAPTAGLHFTPELLGDLATRGVGRADVVLHVGTGTFKPISSETVEGHEMHAEWCSMDEQTLSMLTRIHEGEGRVIPVGTTSARTIESYAERGEPCPDRMETRLLICPGYRWRVTDGLLTNFHLPRSTLLAMVAALFSDNGRDGIGRLLGYYRVAIAEGYRFYSYGDAMLVLP